MSTPDIKHPDTYFMFVTIPQQIYSLVLQRKHAEIDSVFECIIHYQFRITLKSSLPLIQRLRVHLISQSVYCLLALLVSMY